MRRFNAPWRKRPSAPLLGVVDIQNLRNQARSRLRCRLVEPDFRAGGVEEGLQRPGPHICPVRFVLRAEAEVVAVRGVVEGQVPAVGVDGCLDVVGVVAQVDPGLAICGFAEGVVYRCDIGRGREVGDVAAEFSEVGAVDAGVPVELLICATGIHKRSAD